MAKRKPEIAADLHTNKVWHILCYLEPAEHKRLLKYLKSPYFNQSKTLITLYEILYHYLEGGKPGFIREIVWQKLFPHEPYDDVNFRKYCSDLLGQVEGFMAQEIIEQDKMRKPIATFSFVVQRKIEPLYNSAFRQTRIVLEQLPYRSPQYYFNAYEIEWLYYARMNFNVTSNAKSNIGEIAYNLDLFYWIEKIKSYNAVLSQRRTSKQRYDFNFIEEIIAYLSKFPLEAVPELAIHYYSFLTLQEEDNVTHYHNLRRLLDTYGTAMPQQEAIELFDSALHYCTGKINQGNREFLQEYFDVFETAITKGVFLQKGELATWRFNNIVAAALRLGKLDWAENFVNTYKDYLPADTRENTYTFNLARVYRYQRKFDKVMALLNNLEYEDVFYNLISKAILIITYYELEEYDALDSFTEAFRVFLNRHKNITQQPKKIHLNLIKYVRRLTRILPGDKEAIRKLREEIIREKATTVNHEWLLEKLDELE